jgi:ferric-dicitrate binding protein FerR (iron transport regulator)
MDRKKYFEKYLDGTASMEEKEIVTAWVTGLLERVSEGGASVEEQQIVDLWLSREKNILSGRSEMELRKKATSTLLEKSMIEVSKRQGKYSFFKYAAAAVFLIALGFAAYYIYPARQEKIRMAQLPFPTADTIVQGKMIYRTAVGSAMKKIQLPDSSFVYLNANTSISLDSVNYNMRSRDLALNDGEAFFQVAKNKSKKFTVRFGELQLQVMGTSFDIENYKNTNMKSVFVKTGKVIIKNNMGTMTTLVPSDRFVYNTVSKKFSVTKNYNRDLSQWVNGQMLFGDAGIAEIKQKLENCFSMNVVIENNALPKTLQLNATFSQTDDLHKIVNVIAGIYNVRVRVEDGKIIFYK